MLASDHSFDPIVIKSIAPQTPDLQEYGSVRSWRGDTRIHQPNMVSSILPSHLSGDWRHAADFWSGSPFAAARQYQYALRTFSIVRTINPVVQMRCTKAQNVSTGLSETGFPVKRWRPLVISKRNVYWQDYGDQVKPFNVTVPDSTTLDNMHIEWVPLPVEDFGPVSGGIVLQYPNTISKSAAAVVGCSVGAGWCQSEIRSDSNAYGAAWKPDESHDMSTLGIRDDLNASSREAKDHFRLITIRDRWFKYLNAIVATTHDRDKSSPSTILQQIFSDAGISSSPVDTRTQPIYPYDSNDGFCSYRVSNSTQTDVERLNVETCGRGDKTAALKELILATTILNGLSRHGSRHVFEPESIGTNSNKFQWRLKDIPKAKDFAKSLISNKGHDSALLPPLPGSDFVTLHLRFKVYGYAWFASSASDDFATVVVCIYLFIAVTHTLWILTCHNTSCSWDTITELLAIALQSPIATALLGSGAGIERVNTYKKLVRLKALNDSDGESQGVDERLVLVLETENEVERGEKVNTSEHLSNEVKNIMVTSAALATARVCSTLRPDRSRMDQKEPYAVYTKLEADKKYL